MTNPTDQELNAVLARVAGVEVRPSKAHRERWLTVGIGRLHSARWDPILDANQMEMAEEALIKSVIQYEFYAAWCPAKNSWEAFCSEYGKAGRPVFHPDKKRAFALAVAAMEQGKELP